MKKYRMLIAELQLELAVSEAHCGAILQAKEGKADAAEEAFKSALAALDKVLEAGMEGRMISRSADRWSNLLRWILTRRDLQSFVTLFGTMAKLKVRRSEDTYVILANADMKS